MDLFHEIGSKMKHKEDKESKADNKTKDIK